jgi:hypothetical protein
MGGSNSGRWGGRPTAEACGSFRLSLRRLGLADGALIECRYGYEADGDEYPVRVLFDLREPANPFALIRHNVRAGDGEEIEYRVGLARTPCRFGGTRLWWQCPATGARAFKLFLPRGGRRFLSRQAYRLGYATQRMSALDRAHRAKDKIERRLWWYDDGTPCRAPGMRRRTFEKLVARWEAADEKLEALWEPRTLRLMARMMGMG